MSLSPVTLLLLFSIVHSCRAVCTTTPFQHEISEFKTLRYFCEYEHNDKIHGVTKIRLGQGSVFEAIDSCQRCQCSDQGLDCCESGLRVEIPPASIPIECHVIQDGCDRYLVLKSDNDTDCATGRPARLVSLEQQERNRKRQYVQDMLYREVMKSAELSNGANAEYEGNPLQPWVLMDYFLNDAYVGRIPSQVIEQKETALATPKTNIADTGSDVTGKPLDISAGGPDTTTMALMEKLRKYNLDGNVGQRSPNMLLLYLLSSVLS